MMRLNRSLAGLALALLLTAPSVAEGLSASQQQSLAKTIRTFDAAVVDNDIADIIAVVPPKVIDRLASGFGVTSEQLIAQMQKQIDELMADMTLESFTMDVDGVDFVTQNGLTYGLIPTQTVIDTGGAGGKYRSSNTTLALLENEKWYLVRVDSDQQIQVLREVYPALADVQFPAGTSEPVTE